MVTIFHSIYFWFICNRLRSKRVIVWPPVTMSDFLRTELLWNFIMKQIIKGCRIKIQLHIQSSIFVCLPKLNVKDCMYYYIDLIGFFLWENWFRTSSWMKSLLLWHACGYFINSYIFNTIETLAIKCMWQYMLVKSVNRSYTLWVHPFPRKYFYLGYCLECKKFKQQCFSNFT